MSNNLKPCLDARCNCGRYISIGESKSIGHCIGSYTCPDCANQHLTAQSLTSKEYYEQMKR